ncbi:MAG TPA: zinc ribbon domain-containing protein [Candidatus Binataceae bacterium]|nr:zinc ribbon domain-containing protein [Candidatus Binataceae bacterium]
MAESGATRARFCSQCGHPVTVTDAVFCKQCGAKLDGAAWLGQLGSPAAIAVVLSLVPGLGHFYAGRTGRALGWFIGTLLAYGTSPSLGVLIHIVCAVSAARAATLDAERRGIRSGALTAEHRPQ